MKGNTDHIHQRKIAQLTKEEHAFTSTSRQALGRNSQRDEKEREKIKQMNKNKRRKELVKVWSRIKDSATRQLKDFNTSSRDLQKQRVRFPLKPPQASSVQKEVQGRRECGRLDAVFVRKFLSSGSVRCEGAGLR